MNKQTHYIISTLLATLVGVLLVLWILAPVYFNKVMTAVESVPWGAWMTLSVIVAILSFSAIKDWLRNHRGVK